VSHADGRAVQDCAGRRGRARRCRPRAGAGGARSAAALVLACLAAGVGAPAAQALEEEAHDSVTFGCRSVTYSFFSFPNASGNTVTEKVFVDGIAVAATTFSFDGETGSNSVPVTVPAGHHAIDAYAHWNTNGVKGGRDQPLKGGITCAPEPAFTIGLQQRLAGGGGEFTSSPLEAGAGQTVEYEIKLSNTGNTPLGFPAGDAYCPEDIGPGGTTLAPGESATFLCTHVLTEADAATGVHSETISDTATPPEGEGSPVQAASNTVEVLLLRATALPLSALEGQAFGEAVVAEFSDPNLTRSASEYTAVIEWGDGTSSAGSVAGGAGSFAVAGGHVYAEEGIYPVSVVIGIAQVPESSSRAGTTASVADAPLAASGSAISSGLQFSGQLASFSDADPGAVASDFSARVEWGDGTSSAGSVSSGGAGFAVSAGHNYAQGGTFAVTIRIADAGGASALAQGSITIPSGASSRTGSTTASGSSTARGQGGVLGFHGATGLPLPVAEKTANLTPATGRVLIEVPGSSRFTRLTGAVSVPLGTIIDATHGVVRLVSATDANGHTEMGTFYGGIFRLTQTTASVGGRTLLLTVLTLAGPAPTGCATSHKAKRASLAARRRTRKLWGEARGNFRTVGRYAAATVRGTKWLTEDTCTGTFVRVAKDVVLLTDFPHNRTFSLAAPRGFLARPGRGG
jgi:hypothetical protein